MKRTRAFSVEALPQWLADQLFGFVSPANPVYLQLGRQLGMIDPKRNKMIAQAVSTGLTVGIVGGLDYHERCRLVVRMQGEGVDTKNPQAIEQWLDDHPSALAWALRDEAMRRRHHTLGVDAVYLKRYVKGGEA